MPQRETPSAPLPPERKIGRTDPPRFFFEALRTHAFASLEDEAGLAPKCVAIVAPVGYGKTVLMSMLFDDLRLAGKRCLWFALDDRDRTLDTVLADLVALLHEPGPEIHPTQALFRGQDPIETRMDAVIGRMNRYPVPVTIFLDNLNYCDDATLGEFLERLIYRTRASVRLCLSSTHDLPADIARAQLEGIVRLIGPGELSFDRKAITEILGTELCGRIGPEGIDDLVQKTEGWPAAVRMAQIVLSHSDEPGTALASFSGSDETLAQLLNRQALSGFAPEIRDFLLCLALLRTFCVEICNQAIGGTRAGEHLAYLIERNVFIIPLDRNRRWYRLHALFRDHLMREAELTLDTPRRRAILERAALWCQGHGYLRDAVEYALHSGSAGLAERILEAAAPSFVRDRGDIRQYILWVETLHKRGRPLGPEAEYWFAWALAFHRRYEYARRQALTLGARLQKTAPDARGAELSRRIAILRTSIDALTDQIEDAHLGAAKWLAEAGAGEDNAFNLTAAHCIQCGYFTNAFRFAAAHRAIQSAREAAFQADSIYVDGWVASYAGLIAVQEGNYAAAYPELVGALETARAALGDGADICGTMALVAARCAVGMGLEEEARQLLALGMATSRTHGFLEAAAAGLEAGLLLWRGRDNEGLALSDLRDVTNAYPPRLSRMFSCWLARRLLRLGRVDEARSEMVRAGLDAERGRRRASEAGETEPAIMDVLYRAVRIEAQTAAGRYAQATPLITHEQQQAQGSGCAARQVELALDSAAIAFRTDETALSIRHLTRALRIAAPRRIWRPFMDHSETLTAVIADTKASAWGFATDQERRFFAQLCRTLPGMDPQTHDRVAAPHEEPKLLGALTPREFELLGFVHAGLSNQQIADRLEITLRTVKWHLQNAYAKLGVSSRAAALARARALKLDLGP